MTTPRDPPGPTVAVVFLTTVTDLNDPTIVYGPGCHREIDEAWANQLNMQGKVEIAAPVATQTGG